MKVSVRPFESTDLGDGVQALRPILYPGRPEAYDFDWFASVWRWLESHPLAAAGELHRWVLTADDGQVVGFLGSLPQTYRIGRQRVVAHSPAGYMVHPRYGFHALTLMRKFFRTCRNSLSCDQAPGVIAIETRLGAEEVGRLQYAAKFLSLTRLPSPAPASALPLLNGGLRAADTVLTTAFGARLKVEVLDGFDERFDGLFEAAADALPCLPEKDAAFLRWRYGPGSPQAPVTVLGVNGADGLLGYAVLWTASQGRDGYVLDLLVRPRRYDVARALLRESVRHFARAGVSAIRYRFLESPVAPRLRDLGRLGFFLRRERRPTLLVRFQDRNLHELARNPARWAYSIGDGELSFWYS